MAGETAAKQIEVPDLDAISVAFGCVDHLPEWDDIPEEFRNGWHSDKNLWCALVGSWFFNGLDYEKSGLAPKPGVDKTKALAALGAALRSFQPKHEHKIAGVAYLMSQWFDLKDATPA